MPAKCFLPKSNIYIIFYTTKSDFFQVLFDFFLANPQFFYVLNEFRALFSCLFKKYSKKEYKITVDKLFLEWYTKVKIKVKESQSQGDEKKMATTDRIEAFINELFRQQDDASSWIEVSRGELAELFECVPSQVTYTIATRFSPKRGFTVESRRGGGGSIRIRRVSSSGIYDAIEKIAFSTTLDEAQTIIYRLRENGFLNEEAAEIISAAVSDSAIPIANPYKDAVRSTVLKSALAAAAKAK